MSIESSVQSLGLSLTINDPLWFTDSFYSSSNFDEQIDSWEHALAADIGYDSASFVLRGPQEEIEDWIAYGLGRDVKAYNVGLSRIWEGFVNSISANIGTLSAARGPLLDVANNVKLVFSTVDTSVDPPAVGVRESTDWASDTDSQGTYGIIEKVLSTGGASAANAAQIRDVYLQENKNPETTQTISLSSSQVSTVTLNCLGYYHFFKAYIYNTMATGTETISNRIQQVISADPNSIISTDFSRITANASTVPARDNDDKIALSVLKGLVERGDAAYNRYTLAVYDDQNVYYSALPTALKYVHRITGSEQRIEEYQTNNRVYPWDVKPAEWLFLSDFLVGKIHPTELREDPRNMLIENVKFTAPWGLELNGMKVNTLSQFLGQLGLSGIGA